MGNPPAEHKKPNGNAITPPTKPAFEPKDKTQIKRSISLPDELWHSVLECPCTFPTSIFNTVMLNLIKNPNITSSHLFRADIFYDSENDHNFNPDDGSDPYKEGLVRHLKADLKPTKVAWPDFRLERTIVRQLIPRNPQLDKPLVQTCHVFQQYKSDGSQTEERTLVLYIPHVLKLEEMPFYHPTVSQLAFLHSCRSSSGATSQATLPPVQAEQPTQGTLTLLYRLFPDETLTTKLERTALKLLQTIHKHGQGQLVGYEKRVHHDQLIPQKRYQDTYTRLKAKYGRYLSENWVEVTDPGKHVFEDIGIAAFMIELWRDMYAQPLQAVNSDVVSSGSTSNEAQQHLPPFPGFVDIGCGNGILTYILMSEGYPGSGFDARQRKTWSIFPAEIQSQLEQKILVPAILQQAVTPSDPDYSSSSSWHSGIFTNTIQNNDHSTDAEGEKRGPGDGKEGPFILSNHADELTPWTPLLAYLNRSSFIVIPCCSHDLSGARFRAPAHTASTREEIKDAKGKGAKGRVDHPLAFATAVSLSAAPRGEMDEGGNEGRRLPQQCPDDDYAVAGAARGVEGMHLSGVSRQAAETGSLTKSLAQKKMASAYSTLCSYVTSLAEEVGFEAESDTLRIPSTRNACIVGRRRRRRRRRRSMFEGTEDVDDDDETNRRQRIVELVERELKKDIATVAMDWIERAEKLMKKPSSGH
ncbi:Putative tRNA (uracil-O(2)-)-methyltransferase [Septoria linicola]|uniref:tRNA (uracil-O(2)-)-methyltransferase n=1 Tax=Septoria linicola TaxID=215465 RepID=A0A9Q9AIP9_9PEZI|nr:putative tRNA (uracil-O(2)-)-methyltransferase [Septoria linicola]USW48549.1 Putative tRNA (uracil-O(2)-)-methyltransferase [Septoria linicola]